MTYAEFFQTARGDRQRGGTLKQTAWQMKVHQMTWQENILRWQALPEERKLQIRWEAIPRDVSESMAFEREPVLEERLRATLARIEPPALLRPRAASSATAN
jgi:hypothetical protein